MSLAPASSRGAFLNARFAVNGIQCAARSLGTLTAAGFEFFASMVASSEMYGVTGLAQAISFVARRERQCRAKCATLLSAARWAFLLQFGRADPEHLAFGILGIEP